MDEPFACPGCYKSECVCADLERRRENWDLIVSHLRVDNVPASPLTWEQLETVRHLGDGLEQPVTFSELWDWRHIRDSSPEAKERMAEKIRAFLGTAEGGHP